MTEQPDPSDPSEPPILSARQPGPARLFLRISMVAMAVAMVAFAYFTPVWLDRGLTKANEIRLRSIAEETAEVIREKGWTAAQGVEYAQRQIKLGNLETAVDITIADTAVTVRITGTAVSANPFAALTGADRENRIEVTHTSTK